MNRQQIEDFCEHHSVWSVPASDPGSYRAQLADTLRERLVHIGPSAHLEAGPVGSRHDTVRFIRLDGTNYARTGCFLGTLDEFEAAVNTAYAHAKFFDNARPWHRDYTALITAFRMMTEIT